MFKTVKIDYEKGYRIWEVEKDGKPWRTVIFHRPNTEGPSRVSLYIDEQEEFGCIIDNTDWDIICFDLEYSPEEILTACRNYEKFVRENWKEVGREKQKFDTYDDMMEVLS